MKKPLIRRKPDKEWQVREVSITDGEYFKYANTLAKSVYNMTTIERRLVYIALSQTHKSSDNDLLRIDVYHALKILNMKKGTTQIKTIEQAAKSAHKKLFFELELEKLPLELKHYYFKEWDFAIKNGWIQIPWFSWVAYDSDDKVIYLRIHEMLEPFTVFLFGEFQFLFLNDVSKLQSKYSQHWYEIIMSKRGHADENDKGHFFVKLAIEDIRVMFKLENKYKTGRELRRNVIDYPIKEINSSNLGIKVNIDYKYFRRRLHKIELNCYLTGKIKEKPIEKETKTDEEYQKLMDKHPELYDKCYKEAKSQMTFKGFEPEFMREQSVISEAMRLLKKEIKKPKKKKASKKKLRR